MSLRVWLPLVRDNLNQGLDDLQPTNLGTVSFIDGGKLGKCLSAGTSAQTANGISYPTNLVSELGTQFSCAIWVKPLGTHVHYNGTFVSSGNWNTKCWSFGVSQDNTKVDIFSARYNRYIDCTVPVNEWTHLCCTSDNGTVKLYKNGIYIGTSIQDATLTSDASNFCVGRETYAGGYFSFNGNINDLRIYDHVLSPKEVKLLSQGLVCHYKLSDPYIESTTNIVTTTDCLSATCYNGARKKYGYGENTDMYKTTGVFNGKFCTKLYMGTSGESARPYPYINNMFVSNGTNQPKNKTISFDYYGTIGTYINPYKLGSGSATCDWRNNATTTKSGTFTDSGQIPVVPNMWNHISFTLTGTTDANAEWGYIILGDVHTSDTANYWLFANLQIEEKDHETPYAGVGGTRNELQVYDSSGYNNHSTLNLSTSVSSDSPRNLVSTLFGAQNTPKSTFINTSLLSSLTNCTVCWWEKPITTANMLIFSNSNSSTKYIGAGSTSRDLYDSDIGTSGISFYRDGVLCTTTYSGNNVSHADTKHTQNEWHHYALSGINLSSWTQFYINTYNSYPTQSYLSDVRIYATALSQEDIKELYQTGQSISKNKALFAYEFNEPSNGELMNVKYSDYFNRHDPNVNPLVTFTANGEPYFSGTNTGAGSAYVPVNPTNKTYYYDMMLSVSADNLFYVGWERYDKDFTPRSNNACVYVYATKPSSDVVRQRYRGTVNLSTDGVNPCAFIALRILNGWSSTTGTATVHYLSLREVDNSVGFHTSFGKNGIATTDLFLEPNGTGDIEKTGIINMTNFYET